MLKLCQRRRSPLFDSHQTKWPSSAAQSPNHAAMAPQRESIICRCETSARAGRRSGSPRPQRETGPVPQQTDWRHPCQSPALVEYEILWHSSCRCQNRGTLHAPGALHSLIPTFLSTSWLGFASLPGWRCSRLRSDGKFMKSRSGHSTWVL